jgi:hypothetical protein
MSLRSTSLNKCARDCSRPTDACAPPACKGAGYKKVALVIAYKLLDAAQRRCRRFNGPKDCEQVTDDDHETTDERVAA